MVAPPTGGLHAVLTASVLVIATATLAAAQALLIARAISIRGLAARVSGEPPGLQLLWATLPAVLLGVLLLYSVLRAGLAL